MFCFGRKKKAKEKNSQNFDKALEFTFRWEGGYVDDPDDPGGETKYGITKRTYPNEDIKNLTKERAKEIYKKDFWDAAGCQDLKWPVNCVVFDMAVNMGVGRAKKILSKTEDPTELIDRRDAYYIRLAEIRPVFKKYIKGWFNRTSDLRKFIAA